MKRVYSDSAKAINRKCLRFIVKGLLAFDLSVAEAERNKLVFDDDGAEDVEDE